MGRFPTEKNFVSLLVTLVLSLTERNNEKAIHFLEIYIGVLRTIQNFLYFRFTCIKFIDIF